MRLTQAEIQPTWPHRLAREEFPLRYDLLPRYEIRLMTLRFADVPSVSPLRRGDVVVLRSPLEILETLDDSGALDGVPFMPEMLAYFGRRFTVSARVERACDTIEKSGARRMPDTVMLDDLRCDGSGHEGCQAGCRLYWREAWVRRVEALG